jgi:hypothetical protein
MKSIRYALVATFVIAIVLVVFGALSAHALAIYKPGVELALGWRLAMYIHNQLLVVLPLSFVVIGAAALVGAWLTPESTQVERLLALVTWTVLAVAMHYGSPLVFLVSLAVRRSYTAVPYVILGDGLGTVAGIAALVLGVRVVWVWFRSRRA